MSRANLHSTIRRYAAPIAISVVTIILAITFRAELANWFGGEASAPSEAVKSKSAGISLSVTTDPDTPRQGKNTIVVALSRAGETVDDAEVTVEVWMPAMGAMPEMRSKAQVQKAAPGEYRAEFELSMGGSWTATVKASAAGNTLNAEYGLTVGTQGLRLIGDVVSTGSAATGAVTTETTSAPPQAMETPYSFSSEARASLQAGLDAYEAIRSSLATDKLSGVPAASALLIKSIDDTTAAEPSATAPVLAHLSEARAASESLASVADLAQARSLFSSLSEHLVALVSGDPNLAQDRHIFECPMWKGFNQWMQPTDDLQNPYMGQAMLTCGSEQEWSTEGDAKEPDVHDPNDIAHYTCSMHPWVKQGDPDDICPVCSMDLAPVTKEEITDGILRIDRERRQVFGVKTAKVERKKLTVPIRAVGRVAYNERLQTDVTLKYKGWIERLHVEETGQRIVKGQPLFEVYGPELFAAQHELILAAKKASSASSEMQKSRAQALLKGARMRFRLWDFSAAQINAIIAKGQPKQRLTVRSPATGYVIQKDIVEGAAVSAGQRLFRIADLKTVWVEVEVFEHDLPLIRMGQTAKIRLSTISGVEMSGKISFISPAIDPKTRAAQVRVELANDDLTLRPEMFAEVDIEVERDSATVVPESAIVYSGPRRIVFVDIGDDRLRPTLVEIGAKAGGYFEVRKGLEPGDKVVVSGNFLVAAESRLKSSTGIW